MNAFAGTGTLVRFILRRDRVRLPIWIVAIAVTVVGIAWTYPESFPTQSEIDGRISMIRDNPAAVSLTGPGHGLETVTPDSYGPMIVNDMGTMFAIAVALMSIFLVIRHTRAEEESGRSELIRAAVVGPHAHTAAAFLVAVIANVVLAVAIGVGLTAFGLNATGSFAFGVGMAAIGIVFGGISAAAAQITQHAGGATAIGGVALALAVAIRGLGDVQESVLSWFSPIGWAQAMRPFAGEQWWPLLLSLGLAVLAMGLAFNLSTRRDVGAGLMPARLGPDQGTERLGTPLGLAMRLQRGSLIGWTIGLLLGGIYTGAMASEAEAVFGEMEIYQEYVIVEDATLTEGLLATFIMWLVLVSAGYAIGATSRIRSEENAGHSEAVLATAVSRVRYAASILGAALLGTVLVVGALGVALGLVRALDTGDGAEFFQMVVAALAHLPALWLLIGMALALIGFAPRAIALVWVLVAYIVMVEMFGPLLGLPNWMYEGSPFRHTPQLPAGDVSLLAMGILTVVAIGLMILGILGFRRRDLYA
jgi:ABC-2 type transport system permease protein